MALDFPHNKQDGQSQADETPTGLSEALDAAGSPDHRLLQLTRPMEWPLLLIQAGFFVG